MLQQIHVGKLKQTPYDKEGLGDDGKVIAVTKKL